MLLMKPGSKDRDTTISKSAMAFLFVAGLVAVGVDSRVNTNARAQDVMSPCDISLNGGQTFGLDSGDTTQARHTSSSIYHTAVSTQTLGGCLDNAQTLAQVLSSESGGGALDATSRFVVVSPTKMLDENPPLSTATSSQTATSVIVGALKYHDRLHPFSLPYNFSHQNSTVNTALESTENGDGKRLGYGQGSNSGLQMIILLGFLAATALVFSSSFPLLTFVEIRFKRNVFQFLKSPFEFNLCEELENIVPGFLLRNGLVDMDKDSSARFVPPLGYVILTASGTCSIDPRPSRQITEEEDQETSKFGVPVEALAYPRSPLAPLTSCLAGSRPESPISKAPRKVTFADENEVFEFPCVNLTRDRNIRRRLSQSRLNSAVANNANNNAGKHNNVSVAKRR